MSEDEDSPWEPDEGRFSITLKGHGDYSATWANISDKTADGLKRRILDFFGWSYDENAELSLSDVVFNATQQFHAQYNIGAAFSGARAIGSRRGSARERAYQAVQEEQVTEEQAPDPREVLLAQIEEQTSVIALKRLYGEHKALFEEKDEDGNLTPAAAELLAAYKAKGRALSK